MIWNFLFENNNKEANSQTQTQNSQTHKFKQFLTLKTKKTDKLDKALYKAAYKFTLIGNPFKKVREFFLIKSEIVF